VIGQDGGALPRCGGVRGLCSRSGLVEHVVANHELNLIATCQDAIWNSSIPPPSIARSPRNIHFAAGELPASRQNLWNLIVMDKGGEARYQEFPKRPAPIYMPD
jgi:hypothetical protein